MIRLAVLISFVSGFITPFVFAEPLAVYQINQGSGVYLQATLTHDIFRYSLDRELKDLVVIDSHGNQLPSQISVAPMQINQKNDRIPLTFFPVAVGVKPDSWMGPGNTLVRIDNNSLSISTDKEPAYTRVAQQVAIDFYLLDIQQLANGVDSLSLDWLENESDQLIEVQVSGTDDLQNWVSLAVETLVKLQKDGQSLVRNQIDLESGKNPFNYLKVKFLRGGERIQLQNIYAHTKTYLAATEPVETWRVSGKLATDQHSIINKPGSGKVVPVAAWEYHRDDQAPVSRLQIALGETVYGDNIGIFSRKSEAHPWRLVRLGIWFNARSGADWQHSDAMGFAANTDPYWRIELDQSVRDQNAPELVFEHPLHTLKFIASNAAPYSLTIDPDTQPYTNAQIFSQLMNGKTPDWVSVNLIALNPAIEPRIPPAAGTNWRLFLFWGLLLAAVGILIALALRLYREVK